MRFLARLKAVPHKLRYRLRRWYWQRVAPVSTIKSCHWGSVKERVHNKLCLFSTYDPKGRIDPYVREYIRNLYDCGFDIVLISTSPAVHPADLGSLKDVCRAIIHRRNVGLDFGSWKAATDYIPDWKTYDGMLLTNDSIYGPFKDLRPLFQKMDAAEEQICGLTDNFEVSYHVQSFFLYFKQPLLSSEVFQSFWQGIRLYLDKDFIINSYEVGLSQHLLHHDIKIKALFPYYDVRECALAQGKTYRYHSLIRRQPINSSIYMWEILLKNFDFPFLKTEIVKTNRLQYQGVVYWRAFIPDESAQWRRLIEDHLKRAVPNARG